MKAGKLVKVRGADSHKAPPWLALRLPWLPTPLDESRHGFLFGGPTVDIQNN